MATLLRSRTACWWRTWYLTMILLFYKLDWCCVTSKYMKGIEGRQITWQCPYPREHRNNRMFICKGNQRSDCTDMMGQTRFAVHSVSSSSFSVSITNLEARDAGTYWCLLDTLIWTAFATNIFTYLFFPCTFSNVIIVIIYVFCCCRYVFSLSAGLEADFLLTSALSMLLIPSLFPLSLFLPFFISFFVSVLITIGFHLYMHRRWSSLWAFCWTSCPTNDSDYYHPGCVQEKTSQSKR
uniref:Immunoglobulin V-set domain-containing protein n=1 Tax=Poecilia latipinna TaxID=48699 RepID=A0A3B3U5Y9_9TELE